MGKFLSLLMISILAIDSEAAIIVKLKKNVSAKQVTHLTSIFKVTDDLVEDLNIFLIEPKANRTSKQSMRSALGALSQMDFVEYAQEDHPITLREKVPNDAQYGEQWHLDKISAPAAWDHATGGKNALGNAPVVAIVDQGMDINHQDLKENIWLNTNEIPDNGVDDDNNGYVDDLNGWNAVAGNGNVTNSSASESHSTHVAGIAGAKGNNSIQVSGVNWELKIMAVKVLGGQGSLTSLALKAYGYVLKQKKLWLETNGEKGANIVATNSSFGVDYADCKSGDYPAWNDIYNEMGKYGILSAAATANLNIDVDVSGDVPTGCDSPYIVSVTNTTNTDNKSSSAAYGKTMVDIGAPGTSILSTIPGNGTGYKSGTSMATPVISGAIALLHTMASPALATLAVEKPAAAAQAIKNILLETVDKVAALDGQTVSGGRVNLSRAARDAAEYTVPPQVGYRSALMYFMKR